MNLRDAAEAVRVLDVLLVPLDELTALEKFAETLSGAYLTVMGTDKVRQRKERLYAAVIGIQGDGADDIGPAGKAHALEDGPDSMGAHELGAVKKGKAFLGLQFDGLPAFLFPYFGRGTLLTFIQYFSKADERKAQVGKGSEVSGCTKGTLLVNNGKDVLIEHVDEPLRRDELDTGMTVCKVPYLEEKHELDNFRAHFFTRSAGV